MVWHENNVKRKGHGLIYFSVLGMKNIANLINFIFIR